MVFQGNSNELIELTEPQPKRFVHAQSEDFPCPFCGATRFRHEEVSGRIYKSGFVVEDVVYLCLGCESAISQKMVEAFFGK
jgi:hypothetical protein